MRNTTRIFKALSDPNRLRILMMLREKSLCVCEMVDVLNLANSTVSKHLSVLRNVDLILDEKQGRWVNYRLANSDESPDIGFVLNHLELQLKDSSQITQDREKLTTVDRFVLCAPAVVSVHQTG
ncbi:MAG: winged helix-turn-helix transcriptional regulator [Candidatus Marinimicrobia bacterium]|nr:winged helix-turn-helix transcriptional regulator [Candidatus Neomarinimicrobiota bacterium]